MLFDCCNLFLVIMSTIVYMSLLENKVSSLNIHCARLTASVHLCVTLVYCLKITQSTITRLHYTLGPGLWFLCAYLAKISPSSHRPKRAPKMSFPLITQHPNKSGVGFCERFCALGLWPMAITQRLDEFR